MQPDTLALDPATNCLLERQVILGEQITPSRESKDVVFLTHRVCAALPGLHILHATIPTPYGVGSVFPPLRGWT